MKIIVEFIYDKLDIAFPPVREFTFKTVAVLVEDDTFVP